MVNVIHRKLGALEIERLVKELNASDEGVSVLNDLPSQRKTWLFLFQLFSCVCRVMRLADDPVLTGQGQNCTDCCVCD